MKQIFNSKKKKLCMVSREIYRDGFIDDPSGVASTFTQGKLLDPRNGLNIYL